MSNAQGEAKPELSTTVDAVAWSISKILAPGEVASLRRLRPEDVGSDAFWRIVAAHLAPVLADSGPFRDEAERRWAVVVQAMAEMRGLHARGLRLGRALAAAGLSEQRAVRLLRASGASLADAVRVTAHYLASTATASDHADLARLVLSDGRRDEEDVRRRIARDLYAGLAA